MNPTAPMTRPPSELTLEGHPAGVTSTSAGNDTNTLERNPMSDLTVPEAREQRNNLVTNTDVLDKVKALLLMPDGVHAMTEQVANYFEVPVETIKSVVKYNRAEIESDGYRVITRGEFAGLNFDLASIAPQARSIAMFPRRAILRVAMLLRDSVIARQIRDLLLDIEQAARVPFARNEFDVMRAMIDQLEASRREASEAKAIATKTEARLDAIEGRHDWYSALGYARLNGHDTNSKFLNRVGRKATPIAKRNGITAVKVQHAMYGEANSYPAWVWELAFEEAAA